MQARYDAAGDRDLEILDCGPDGDDLVIHTRRTVDVEGLPGFASKVIKPTNTMEQVDRWDAPDESGARNGSFTIDVKGAPVKARHHAARADRRRRHPPHRQRKVRREGAARRREDRGLGRGPSQKRLDAEFAFHRTRLDADPPPVLASPGRNVVTPKR